MERDSQTQAPEGLLAESEHWSFGEIGPPTRAPLRGCEPGTRDSRSSDEYATALGPNWEMGWCDARSDWRTR